MRAKTDLGSGGPDDQMILYNVGKTDLGSGGPDDQMVLYNVC